MPCIDEIVHLLSEKNGGYVIEILLHQNSHLKCHITSRTPSNLTSIYTIKILNRKLCFLLALKATYNKLGKLTLSLTDDSSDQILKVI